MHKANTLLADINQLPALENLSVNMVMSLISRMISYNIDIEEGKVSAVDKMGFFLVFLKQQYILYIAVTWADLTWQSMDCFPLGASYLWDLEELQFLEELVLASLLSSKGCPWVSTD